MKGLEIAFVGAGNMADSMIGGLLKHGLPAKNLRAADPLAERLRRLKSAWGVATFSDNREAVTGADVVILAVKPQVVGEVLAGIRDTVAQQGPLVISIAAGIAIASLERWLGPQTPIVRCMPNIPALLQEGATALHSNGCARADQIKAAEQILAAVGTVSWVEEEASLDAVTALSGSGPAYFFLFLEAMVDAGVELGLERATSRELALQTGLGACRMALAEDGDIAALRRRVTSPEGTTQAAIERFEASGLREIVASAMRAARERAREIARELG